MLVNLKIKNVALIESLDITFDKQLNVISGETGSGKSIMLNAMGFVFGDRLDKTLLREGSDSMRVDAFFDTLDASVKVYIEELTGVKVETVDTLTVVVTFDEPVSELSFVSTATTRFGNIKVIY